MTGLSVVPDHVADVGVSIAGANMLLLAVVEAELVFIKRANGDLNNALAVGEDDRLVGHDRAEVLLDRITDSFLVTILVDLPFALE